ncbi:hypothetical protein HDU96_009567 [Phlyctochytrium bullatum]|nr:hypothetical protein HDU96_009567 [Phlyctochytrium bullatum]
MDGLLPQAKQAESAIQNLSGLSRMGRKSLRLSRHVSDKDFMRKQIAEIDKRDERIQQLESVVALLKSSSDPFVQSTIATFARGYNEGISSVEELKEEIFRLRQAKQEMEIVIAEQTEKLEEYEAHPPPNPGAREQLNFEDTAAYQDMISIIGQLRQTVDDRDATIKLLKGQVSDLRTKVRQLETSEFEMLEKLASSGTNNISDPSDRLSSRLRLVESELEKEKKWRIEDTRRNLERIAALEAELTIAKGRRRGLLCR